VSRTDTSGAPQGKWYSAMPPERPAAHEEGSAGCRYRMAAWLIVEKGPLALPRPSKASHDGPQGVKGGP
jgi:hypothetical protein